MLLEEQKYIITGSKIHPPRIKNSSQRHKNTSLQEQKMFLKEQKYILIGTKIHPHMIKNTSFGKQKYILQEHKT